MVDARRRLFLRGKSAAAEPAPPRPPWALRPDSAFTTACTRCGDCISACPRQVLAAGDGGFPRIDFSHVGCSLCGDCSRACTTGAIQATRPEPAFPWTVQAQDHCLARRGVECRVCGDACDARALRFVPALGGIAQLQLLAERCTGCGDCQPTCPVQALTMVPRT